MKYSAILFCGSRALAGTDGEAWARRVIKARVAELPPGGIVIHGGCPGSPDIWAADAGLERGDLIIKGFFADGFSEGRTSLDAPCITGQWRDAVRPATTWEHFKERNMRLVHEAMWREERRGDKALVICLAARDSKTRGGPWTADYARSRGMEAHTWVWS